MKLLVVLAAVVAVAMAEVCTNDAECSAHAITTCANKFHVVCDMGECHCTDGATAMTCTARDDCMGMCKHGHDGHCVDGTCQCKI